MPDTPPQSFPQPMPTRLDHIVVTTPDLEGALGRIEEATGVRLEPGGVHPDFGTRNYLAAFGPSAYLELIGVDEENTTFTGTRPFRIDESTATSTATWAITCDDLETAVAAARAAGLEPGDPEPKSRRLPDGSLLEWRLTQTLPEPSGVVPFLLDWDGATTPAQTTRASLDFIALEAGHPDPESVQPILRAYGTDLPVQQAEPGLRVTIAGPAGHLTL